MKQRIYFMLAVLSFLWSCHLVSALSVHARVYVQTINSGTIGTWPNWVSGDIPPETQITGVGQGGSIAVDDHWIYSVNQNNASIDIRPIDASGNVPPARSIQGANTTLKWPEAVAVDSLQIYVADFENDSVDIWLLSADGNVAPHRSIKGANTLMGSPLGIAVHSLDIYVTSFSNGARINVYRINDNGNVAPNRSITGDLTTLNNSSGIAVDGDWIYVANRFNNDILVWPINADGNVAPARAIRGSLTGLNNPIDVAVLGEWIYVANMSGHNIAVFPINGDGNIAPERTIQGESTKLGNAAGIAVTEDPPVYPPDGTVGTQTGITGSGFGTKKGKVLVGNVALKVLKWTDSVIQCSVPKALPPGMYDVTVQPWKASSIVFTDAFTMMGPEIDSIDPSHGAADDDITIGGFFFVTTRGKITLGGKNCKVLSWTMEPITGKSEIKFVIPRGLSPGIHELKLTNKVGTDSVNFTMD